MPAQSYIYFDPKQIGWPWISDRVLTMPCIMTCRLPYTNGKINAVSIAFGLKAKPLGGVEFVYTAAWRIEGRFRGWNWKWSLLRSHEVWSERLVYITNTEDQFCFEAPLRYFRFMGTAGQMREKLIMDKWRPGKKTQDMSIVDWILVFGEGFLEIKDETMKNFEEPVETETIEETDENSMELEGFVQVFEAYAESEAESFVTIGSEVSTAPKAPACDLR
jgi:hypothetical protein